MSLSVMLLVPTKIGEGFRPSSSALHMLDALLQYMYLGRRRRRRKRERRRRKREEIYIYIFSLGDMFTEC